jgi:TatD DNase family protein
LPLLTDTHCHIDLEQFDSDRQAMIDRAWQVGIERLLIPAVELSSTNRSLAIAEIDERIFIAVGVHPNNAGSWNANTSISLQALCVNPRVKAIGEIGLDYYRKHSTPEAQKAILKEQLTLAAAVDKPVVLHCRAAFDDLFDILTAWQTQLPATSTQLIKHPGVFHSFGGDSLQAQKAIEMGFYLGINGSITFKNATATREMLQSVGIERLVLETDAPYITPVPYRGKRNEPAYIYYTNETLSQLVDLSPDQCAKMTYNNACELFNW